MKLIISAAAVLFVSLPSFALPVLWDSSAAIREIQTHRVMFGHHAPDQYGNFSAAEIERLAPLLAVALGQLPSREILDARRTKFGVSIIKGEKFNRRVFSSSAQSNLPAQVEYVLTIPSDALVVDLVRFFRENLVLESEPSRTVAHIDGCMANLATQMPVY